MLGLPFGIWALFVCCNSQFMLSNPFGPSGLVLPDPASFVLYDHQSMAVFIGWNLCLALLWAVVPGKLVSGVALQDGSRLMYKMNGFSSFVVVSVLLLMSCSLDGGMSLIWVHDHQLQLGTASVLFAAVLSVYLYVSARLKRNCLLSDGGSTGVPHYDFFMGHELNPRLGAFDLKTFFELRPGLIGWTVLNAAMAVKQYHTTGTVSTAMMLVNLFQLTYVVDALWNEAAILTTMDITSDGFGFMLAFGDLAWVPFTYGLQARYLAHTAVTLQPLHVALIVGLKLTGLLIFRGANGQKNTFRSDPTHCSVAQLKSMPTERGTKLIISGWWGVSRHVNYLGDWIMSVAWSLPTGFGHVVPWFYPIYFAVLLVHRERRDEACCKLKYGKDWEKYCALVPYRIVPYVY